MFSELKNIYIFFIVLILELECKARREESWDLLVKVKLQMFEDL
jgi:hypothetical protein